MATVASAAFVLVRGSARELSPGRGAVRMSQRGRARRVGAATAAARWRGQGRDIGAPRARRRRRPPVLCEGGCVVGEPWAGECPGMGRYPGGTTSSSTAGTAAREKQRTPGRLKGLHRQRRGRQPWRHRKPRRWSSGRGAAWSSTALGGRGRGHGTPQGCEPRDTSGLEGVVVLQGAHCHTSL